MINSETEGRSNPGQSTPRLRRAVRLPDGLPSRKNPLCWSNGYSVCFMIVEAGVRFPSGVFISDTCDKDSSDRCRGDVFPFGGSGCRRPTCAIQCIYCIIRWIQSVSASTSDTIRYNTYCTSCISAQIQWIRSVSAPAPWSLVQIRWIRIVHVGDTLRTHFQHTPSTRRSVRGSVCWECVGSEERFEVCLLALY